MDTDEQRDQFRTSISYQYLFWFTSGVRGDMLPQLGIFRVRVRSQHIKMCGQSFFHLRRDAQRIDVGTESGDLFLWNAKIFLDLFQVTAMKMFFSFYFLFHACTHSLISFALVSAMVAKDKPWVL